MADVRYDVEVNTKDAVSEVEKLKKELDKSTKAMKNSDKGSEKMSSGFGKAKVAIVALAAASAAVAVSFVAIASKFETLRATLSAVAGGTEEAAVAFKFIQDIATQLPFSLEETTAAYTKLTALGIAPTREALVSFANTASATGKSLEQVVEAVADATTGEFERLKEFGIKVKQGQDDLKVTFQGTTQSIGKDSASIQEYLTGIGQNEFGGAATAQMDTLAGKFSNFQDTVSRLADQVINGTSAMGFLKDSLSAATSTVEWLAENMTNLINIFQKDLPQAMAVWAGWLGLTGDKTKAFGDTTTGVLNDVKMLFSALFNDTRVLGVALVDGLVTGFLTLENTWNIFNEAMSFSWDSTISGISTAWTDFLNFFISGFNSLTSALDFIPGFEALKVTLIDASVATESWESRMSRVNGEFEKNLDLHQSSINLWLSDIESQKRLADLEKERVKIQDEMDIKGHNADLVARQIELNKQIDAEKKAGEAAKTHSDFLEGLHKRTVDLADANKTNIELLGATRREMLDNKDALLAMGVTTEQFTAALEQLNEQQMAASRSFTDGWALAMDEYIDTTTNGANHARDIFADTTSAMEDSIKSFVTTGKFQFQDLVNSILDSLLDAQISQLTGNLMNSGGGSGGSAVGDFFAGFFANGGLIPAGQVGIVGERGPELISGPANITPLNNTGGGMGGQVTYNINAVDANSFKQLVAKDPAFMYAVTEQGRRSLPSGR